MVKMKHIYQLSDELSVGSELQLQRWRDLLGLVEQQRQLAAGSALGTAQEDLRDLMAEIDETARELAALRLEVEQALHLKRFDLHRFQGLHQTPSAARLEAIWLDQATVLEDLRKLWNGDQGWLENHRQEIQALLEGTASP